MDDLENVSFDEKGLKFNPNDFELNSADIEFDSEDLESEEEEEKTKTTLNPNSLAPYQIVLKIINTIDLYGSATTEQITSEVYGLNKEDLKPATIKYINNKFLLPLQKMQVVKRLKSKGGRKLVYMWHLEQSSGGNRQRDATISTVNKPGDAPALTQLGEGGGLYRPTVSRKIEEYEKPPTLSPPLTSTGNFDPDVYDEEEPLKSSTGGSLTSLGGKCLPKSSQTSSKSKSVKTKLAKDKPVMKAKLPKPKLAEDKLAQDKLAKPKLKRTKPAMKAKTAKSKLKIAKPPEKYLNLNLSDDDDDDDDDDY